MSAGLLPYSYGEKWRGLPPKGVTPGTAKAVPPPKGGLKPIKYFVILFIIMGL